MTKRKEFTDKTKLQAFTRANGRCEKCTRKVGAGQKLRAEYDHIQACVFEGENSLDNCRLLCEECHKPKTVSDIKSLAKTKRIEKKEAGIGKTKKYKWASRPFKKQFKPNVRQINGDLS
jgi:5-methylcytosine-specific restriction endonuclease McrA